MYMYICIGYDNIEYSDFIIFHNVCIYFGIYSVKSIDFRM